MTKSSVKMNIQLNTMRKISKVISKYLFFGGEILWEGNLNKFLGCQLITINYKDTSNGMWFDRIIPNDCSKFSCFYGFSHAQCFTSLRVVPKAQGPPGPPWGFHCDGGSLGWWCPCLPLVICTAFAQNLHKMVEQLWWPSPRNYSGWSHDLPQWDLNRIGP